MLFFFNLEIKTHGKKKQNFLSWLDILVQMMNCTGEL